MRHAARHDDEVAGGEARRLITERMLDLAREDVDHFLAVWVDVLDVALAHVERREPDRLLGTGRIAIANDPVHAAEVCRLGRRAYVAAHLPIDWRDVQR